VFVIDAGWTLVPLSVVNTAHAKVWSQPRFSPAVNVPVLGKFRLRWRLRVRAVEGPNGLLNSFEDPPEDFRGNRETEGRENENRQKTLLHNSILSCQYHNVRPDECQQDPVRLMARSFAVLSENALWTTTPIHHWRLSSFPSKTNPARLGQRASLSACLPASRSSNRRRKFTSGPI